MKILFLGTGAADWPLKKPENATEHRRLSSALIDGELLIDPGPQVLEALEQYGLESVKYVLVTHKHFDHYCADTVSVLTEKGAVLLDFTDNKEQAVGKYKISAYAGNHGTAKETLHYIISDGEKSVFYGLDGAWLLYDEVTGIKDNRPDLAVLDCTVGEAEGDYRVFEHNNIRMVLEMKQTLAPYVDRFCISHMARTLHKPHAELSADMEKQGVTVAYDGLEIEI